MWFKIVCTSDFGEYIDKFSHGNNGNYMKILEENFRFIKAPKDIEKGCVNRFDCKVWLETAEDIVRLISLLGEYLVIDSDNVIEIYDDYRE